jgi:hypothetical protein
MDILVADRRLLDLQSVWARTEQRKSIFSRTVRLTVSDKIGLFVGQTDLDPGNRLAARIGDPASDCPAIILGENIG